MTCIISSQCSCLYVSMIKIKRTKCPSRININTAYESQPCCGVTKWTHTHTSNCPFSPLHNEEQDFISVPVDPLLSPFPLTFLNFPATTSSKHKTNRPLKQFLYKHHKTKAKES